MNKQVLFGIFAGISFVFLGYFLLSQVSLSSIEAIDPPSYYGEYRESFSYNTDVDATSSVPAPVFFGNVTDSVTQDISRELFVDIQSSVESDEKTSSLIKRIQEGGIDEDILTQNVSPQSIGFIESLDTTHMNLSLSQLPSDADRYMNGVGETLSRIDVETEVEFISHVLQEFVEKGDATQLNTLIAKYNSILQDIMSLPVPSQYVDFHEKMVVSFWNFSLFLDAISNIQTDPVRAFVAVEYFPTINQQWNDFATFLNMIQ